MQGAVHHHDTLFWVAAAAGATPLPTPISNIATFVLFSFWTPVSCSDIVLLLVSFFFLVSFLSGAVARARGGAAVIRRHSVAVPRDGGDLVVKSGGDGGLLASYLRALDDKPMTTKVRHTRTQTHTHRHRTQRDTS